MCLKVVNGGTFEIKQAGVGTTCTIPSGIHGIYYLVSYDSIRAFLLFPTALAHRCCGI